MQVYESQLESQNRQGLRDVRKNNLKNANSKRNKHDENGDLLNDGDESDSEFNKAGRTGEGNRSNQLFDDENLEEDSEVEKVVEKFGKKKLQDSD